MMICSPANRSCRRGFNLIEAAIVLGVVGFIIGGIWVAGSALSEQRRVTQSITNILVIKQNIKQLFTPQSADAISGITNLQAWDMGVFKGTDFTLNPVTGLVTDSFNTLPDIVLNGSIMQIALTHYSYDYWPVAQCIKIVLAISGQAHAELDEIMLNTFSGGSSFTIFPIIPTSTQCTDAADLVFRFKW